MSAGPFQRILVATDLEPSSDGALRVALDLARALDAELTILHVADVPTFAAAGMGETAGDLLTPVAEAAEERIGELVSQSRFRCRRVTGTVRLGAPAEQILAAAEEAGADLVVTGTHRRQGLAHAVLGSVAERVVRGARVPVLTVGGGR